MKQVFVLAALFLFLGSVPAMAQEPQNAASSPATSTVTPSGVGTRDTIQPAANQATRPFSKASIERAIAGTAAPVTPQTRKPFFKTPWPYVIGGAIVIILALTLGRSSSPNGIY